MVAARADLADAVHGKALIIEGHALGQDPLEHAQCLDVDDELLVGGEQRTLKPAGRVQHEVHPAQHRRPHAHHRFVGGLRIGRLRRGEGAATTKGDPVIARHLRAGEDAHRRLRGAEGRAARLHVDVGQKRPVDAGSTGTDQLDQRNPGQRLRGLLRERARQAHRRHGAGHQERRNDRRLVRLRIGHQCAEHPVVVAKRAVDVDQGEQRRGFFDIRPTTKRDSGHLDGVAGALFGDNAAHVRLVGPANVGIDHVEMARLEREILGLDDGAARAVDLRRRLRHLVEVREVSDAGIAATAVEVGDERRAIDRGGDHVVAADRDRVRRISRLHLEGCRRLLDLLLDERALEADPVVLRLQPRLDEGVDRARMEEINSDLLQDLHRVIVDLLDLFVGEQVVRLERVRPHLGQEPACASCLATFRWRPASKARA